MSQYKNIKMSKPTLKKKMILNVFTCFINTVKIVLPHSVIIIFSLSLISLKKFYFLTTKFDLIISTIIVILTEVSTL